MKKRLCTLLAALLLTLTLLPGTVAAASTGSTTLAQLPIFGDKSQTTLTAAQAAAYAQKVEELIQESDAWWQQQINEYDNFSAWGGDSHKLFRRAALIAAGKGAPLLWVVYGHDMGYDYYPDEGKMPEASLLFWLEGDRVVEVTLPRGEDVWFDESGLWSITDTWSFRYGSHTEVRDGKVEGATLNAVHGVAYEDWSGTPPTDAQMRQAAEDQARYDADFQFDFSTYSSDKLEYYDYMGTGFVAYLIDGKFVYPDEAHGALLDALYSSYDRRENGGAIGHGSDRHTDVSHSWYGPWAEADGLPELLRSYALTAPTETPEPTPLPTVAPGSVIPGGGTGTVPGGGSSSGSSGGSNSALLIALIAGGAVLLIGITTGILVIVLGGKKKG